MNAVLRTEYPNCQDNSTRKIKAAQRPERKGNGLKVTDPQRSLRNVAPQTAPKQKQPRREGQRPEHPLGAHPRKHFRGKGRRTPCRAREKTCLSCRSPGRAPPRAGAPSERPFPPPPPPPALAGREADARSLPFPSARGEGEGAGRGGARSRAACSRTSPGFGCVRPAARPLPPPPPRFSFAGRRLRGAGASRRRDAAGVHRPPELPGPGARCGALL